VIVPKALLKKIGAKKCTIRNAKATKCTKKLIMSKVLFKGEKG